MRWDRFGRPPKRNCKKCYKRQRIIQKNLPSREKVEIQTVDFGEHPARAFLADTSYRLSYITIGWDPYVGIIKGMDKSTTRTRCLMPLNSWHSMVNEALPKMTYPAASIQLQVDEWYHSTLYKQPIHFINNYHHCHYYHNNHHYHSSIKINGPPKGKSEQGSQHGM